MSSDLLPFARSVEIAKPAGRGADLFLECGHKITVAGDQRGVKAIPCSKCVAAFHEAEDRRLLDWKLYITLQECRGSVKVAEVLERVDAILAILRRRVEIPQDINSK